MALQSALVQLALKGAPATAVMTTNITRFIMDLGKLTCSPAQSSETAIRRGVELATFSSKRVWLALSRPHAFERI